MTEIAILLSQNIQTQSQERLLFGPNFHFFHILQEQSRRQITRSFYSEKKKNTVNYDCLKFRFSEKTTKIWKNILLILTWLSKHRNKWEIFKNVLWPSHNIVTLISVLKIFVFLVLTIMSDNKQVTVRSKCSHGHLLLMRLVGCYLGLFKRLKITRTLEWTNNLDQLKPDYFKKQRFSLLFLLTWSKYTGPKWPWSAQ